jgi:hypothetical protein
MNAQRVPEPTGDSVAMRIFDAPKACRALAPRRPVPTYDGPQDVPGEEIGVQSFATKQGFQRRFRCTPGAFDFKTKLLAVAWGDTSGADRYVVERAVKRDDGITLVIGMTPECKRPARLSPASLVELPRVEGLVGVVMCPRANAACPDPDRD